MVYVFGSNTSIGNFNPSAEMDISSYTTGTSLWLLFLKTKLLKRFLSLNIINGLV